VSAIISFSLLVISCIFPFYLIDFDVAIYYYITICIDFYLLRTLKEELQTAEGKKREVTVTYNTVCEKVNRTNSELSNVSIAVRKLRSAQSECNNLINELKDKIESSEATSADVFVSNSDSFFNDTALAFFISQNNTSYKSNFVILAK